MASDDRPYDRWVANGIDNVKLCAVPPRLHNEWPEMHVRAEHICPQARISLERENCSGSVPSAMPCEAAKAAGPADEQMVRSSRDAPNRWKKRRSIPDPFSSPICSRIAIRQDRFRAVVFCGVA